MLSLLIVYTLLVSAESVCLAKYNITVNISQYSMVLVNVFHNYAVNSSLDSVISSFISSVYVNSSRKCVSKCASYSKCLSSIFDEPIDNKTHNCFFYKKFFNTATEIIPSNYSKIFFMNYNSSFKEDSSNTTQTTDNVSKKSDSIPPTTDHIKQTSDKNAPQTFANNNIEPNTNNYMTSTRRYIF